MPDFTHIDLRFLVHRTRHINDEKVFPVNVLLLRVFDIVKVKKSPRYKVAQPKAMKACHISPLIGAVHTQ